MARKKNKNTFAKRLLVEGVNDMHVVMAFCKRQDIPHTFEVENSVGVEELLKKLPLYLKGSLDEYQTIGVLLDADQDIASRWQSVYNSIQLYFPNVSSKLPSEGLIASNEEGRTIGVWIMPNNELNGMLEDFLEMLVPEKDQLLERVEVFLTAIERDNLQRYSNYHRIKAKLHTWLSVQESPGTPLGQSITKRYLSTNSAVANTFEHWLRNLFQTKP